MINVIVAPDQLWSFFIGESGLDKEMVLIAEDTTEKVGVYITIEKEGATLIVEKSDDEVYRTAIRSTDFELKYNEIINKYIYKLHELPVDVFDGNDDPDDDEIDRLYINYDNAICASCDLIQSLTGTDILGEMIDNKMSDIADKLLLKFMACVEEVLDVKDVFLPGIKEFAEGIDLEENTGDAGR